SLPTAKEVEQIHIEFCKNTTINQDDDNESLAPNDIDFYLQMNERPTVIDRISWDYLLEKSREITTFYNEQLYGPYKQGSEKLSNEKILFHDTCTTNIDGIFKENFLCKQTTDAGWFGKGLYFPSSSRYAIFYSKQHGEKIIYSLCSSVALGKMLHIKDRSYDGEDLHPDYNSHYIRVDKNSNNPITNDNDDYYKEYVVKNNEQVLPLYVIGLRRTSKFVLWRDAEIGSGENAQIFQILKGQYGFNIYASETSDEGIQLLKRKIQNNKKCVVITNGSNNGNEFAHECRKICSTIPILVYCRNVEYHQRWAFELGGTPAIKVTDNEMDIFEYINKILIET
ncbi:unnamed protein product, partial [Didymodactylos carnosus]